MIEHHDAYTELLRRHRKMMWRMCWVCAHGNNENCRDLMQEVSIALWLNFKDLRSDASPHEEQAWVRWLTRSTLNHLRRGEQPPLLPLTSAIADSLTDSDNTAQSDAVDKVMAALNPDEQRILQLRLDGYPAGEIAEIMGLDRNTVYQRIHRALGKARRVLLAGLFTLALSSIAIAVVPQWRQTVFGGNSTNPENDTDTSLPHPNENRISPSDSLSTHDTTQSPAIDVVWNYEGWNCSGWSVTYCRNDSSIVFTRYSPTGSVTATARNLQSIIWNDTLKLDSMNIALKRAASTAVMVALATATQAQMTYDFETVTQQGDTLFCTITDSAQHHVSIRGMEYVWNAPGIRYNDTLIIPATVEHEGEEYTVNALGDSAFRSHGEIKSIVLPTTISTIGRDALAATNIFCLTVPDGMQSIGQNAFKLIKNVVYNGAAEGGPWGALTVNGFIEDGLVYQDSTRTRLTGCREELIEVAVPSSVRVIGRYAFFRTNVRTVTLPEGLDTIGESAFQLTEKLGSITIPSTVKWIGDYSFYSAFRQQGTAKVTIADAECTIGRGAFYYSNITDVNLGTRVISIGMDAFASLSRCDSIIVPNSVTYLAPRVFCYNYNGRLKKVRLPDNVDTLRAEMFHGCMGLREVNIPSTVVYIDSMVFCECFSLKEIILPAGLTYIGEWGLEGCTGVETFKSLATVPPIVEAHTFDLMDANIIFTVPCGSGTAYENDIMWNYFQNIEEDCESVPDVQAQEVSIYVNNGSIIINAAEKEVRIYDIEGRLLVSTLCRGIFRQSFPSGIYLVKIGTSITKEVVIP